MDSEIPNIDKMPPTSLLPISKAATVLGRSPRQMRLLITRGFLPTYPQGENKHIRHYVKTADLKRYIETHKLIMGKDSK